MWESSTIRTNTEWRKIYKNEIEEWEITINKVNEKVHKHLKKFYNFEWKLDINWFLNKADEIVKKIFKQPWENNTFWDVNNFKEFLKIWLKLSILAYNLDIEAWKKIIKSTWRFWYMYWEVLNYWDTLTEDLTVYLEKNRNNEQKKEEIKQLVERDYEIFFWKWAKWKTLNTKVWQTTNEIIEVFSNWYYGSLDNKDTTK